MSMSTIRLVAAAVAVVVTAFVSASYAEQPAAAEAGSTHDLSRIMCKDIMRAGGSDREVAIAFIHGYLIGKANTTQFNSEAAHSANAKFIDHCLDNPNEIAVESMAKFVK